MKSKMTPEEATESFRRFLEHHEERLEHLLTLGMLPEEFRITKLVGSEHIDKYEDIWQTHEIGLSLNRFEATIVKRTFLEKKEPEQINRSTLISKSRHDHSYPKRGILNYEMCLAEKLSIPKDVVELFLILLLNDFDLIGQCFNTEQPPTHRITMREVFVRN